MCDPVGTQISDNIAMKQCAKCNQVLPLDAFTKSVAARRRRGGLCKPCQREYGMAYYQMNKIKINRTRQFNQIRYRARNRKNVREYLTAHPCLDCGETDTRVLEFDHVRGKKEGNVAELVRQGTAWQRIVLEIAKCEVRCANCHRRKTVEQLGWPHANRGVAQLG